MEGNSEFKYQKIERNNILEEDASQIEDEYHKMKLKSEKEK
jgi:hypothetical protein